MTVGKQWRKGWNDGRLMIRMFQLWKTLICMKKLQQTQRNQRKEFNDFCNNLNPSRNLGQIWKGIRGFKNRAIRDPIETRDDNLIPDDPNIKEAFRKISSRYRDNNDDFQEDYACDRYSGLIRTLTVTIWINNRNHKRKSTFLEHPNVRFCTLIHRFLEILRWQINIIIFQSHVSELSLLFDFQGYVEDHFPK